MQPKDYTDNFFEYHLQGAISSAEIIIPIVQEYVNPESVLDIGCGIGAWLSVWKKSGVKNIFGVDGSYVDLTKLLVDKSEFLAVDLEKGYAANKKYDLVTCLEVAEHLPVKSAEIFIKSLCMAGEVILFSAALPGQEGTMHINEQYPDYWVGIFSKNGYTPVDCLRSRIWNNNGIKWWYRQNILFFVKESSIENYPKLKHAYDSTGNKALSLIHPELFEHKTRKVNYYESVLNSGKSTLKYFLANFLGKKNR